MKTHTQSAPTGAIGLNANQLDAIRDAIRGVAKHLKHHPNASQSIVAWIKREYGLRVLQDLPPEKAGEVVEQLERLKGRAINHSVALWSLEKNFIYQQLGIEYLEENHIPLETVVAA